MQVTFNKLLIMGIALERLIKQQQMIHHQGLMLFVKLVYISKAGNKENSF